MVAARLLLGLTSILTSISLLVKGLVSHLLPQLQDRELTRTHWPYIFLALTIGSPFLKLGDKTYASEHDCSEACLSLASCTFGASMGRPRP